MRFHRYGERVYNALMSVEHDRELAEFEAAEHGAPIGEPICAFGNQQEAQAFADVLRRDAQLEAKPVRVRGGDSRFFWDIASPNPFAVDLLYRYYTQRIYPAGVSEQPVATRLRMLSDLLFSRAVRSDNWKQRPCSEADLQWVQSFASLSTAQTQSATERAKNRFFEQHATEKNRSVWIGLGLLAVGAIWALWKGPLTVGAITLGASGAVFLAFSLTRRTR